MDPTEHPLRRKKLLPKRLHLIHLFQKAILSDVKPRRKESPIWNPINRQKRWRKVVSDAANVRPG